MSNKHRRWLLTEIDQWLGENLVDPALATTLRERYAVVDRGWVSTPE